LADVLELVTSAYREIAENGLSGKKVIKEKLVFTD